MLPLPPVHVYVHVSYKGKSHMCYATPTITMDKSVLDHMKENLHDITNLFLPSIAIVHMGKCVRYTCTA